MPLGDWEPAVRMSGSDGKWLVPGMHRLNPSSALHVLCCLAGCLPQVRDFASEAGDVHSAKLIKDPDTKQNKGYGFIK